MKRMTEAQFTREAHYRATLNTAHALTNTGLLTASDVAQIQAALSLSTAAYASPISDSAT